MTISRWKIMAGMFGLSVGGLYAVAGPGTKPMSTTKAPVVMPAAVVLDEPPLVLPASGVMPAAQLVVPAAPVEMKVPATPLPMAPAPSVVPPSVLNLQPDLALPVKMLEPETTMLALPSPVPSLPEIPANLPPSTAPALPTAETMMVRPVSNVSVPAPVKAETMPALDVPPMPPPVAPPEALLPPPIANVATVSATEKVASDTFAVPANRYRITLRVGDGDPVFEVRCGDDLMMKVISEKVDVKSPTEKGQTLSAVKAVGKVRFVGFGAEGVCDELSFLAGSGEVSLTGHVTVKVKDKLGRVESELSGEKMNYRLDASNSLSGGLTP